MSEAFKLDMTMMYLLHDALRREVARLARVTARGNDDPARVLRTALGWEMFKRYLTAHHTTEDDALWDVMRHALVARPDDLALLDAMEDEHAAIDPLLDAVDDALVDREDGPRRLGDLLDALATALTGHLAHEEAEGLRLVDATLDERQWQDFGQLHRARIGEDLNRYLPWVLEDARPEAVARVLARMPERIRVAYAEEWRPAYEALELWPAASRHSGLST